MMFLVMVRSWHGLIMVGMPEVGLLESFTVGREILGIDRVENARMLWTGDGRGS